RWSSSRTRASIGCSRRRPSTAAASGWSTRSSSSATRARRSRSCSSPSAAHRWRATICSSRTRASRSSSTISTSGSSRWPGIKSPARAERWSAAGMWAVHNQTAYAADRTWVRDKHGRHHWIVVVKATFELEPDGRLRLADEQLTPLDEPEYFGEPGRSSLRYEADLVAAKPGTDLILNAHAHAPGGRPTQEVVVTLRLGDLEKTLLVRGESRYQLGLVGAAISTPAPFVSRAIVYEHAFGGTDTLDPDPARH